MIKGRFFKNSAIIATLTGALACTVSCSDDDPDKTTNGGMTAVLKVTGTNSEPEYVVTSQNLMEGTLSAQGTGYESFDWNFTYAVGKSLFVLGYTNFEANVYQANESGDVEVAAKLILESPLETFGKVNDETMLAIAAPRDGSHSLKKLYSMDGESGLIKAVQDIHTIYDYDTGTPGEGITAWPTALEVVGDKLFIPFYPIDDAGTLTTPRPDTAYVAIYSYPDVATEPIKVIKDTRTGNIGANGISSGLIQADNGDLYSFSCGAYLAGFSPVMTKPSGILKIANGETEFDQDYFFNVEAAENGGVIFWMDHLEGNKAIARLLTENIQAEDDPNAFWGAYGRSYFNQKLVIIDLEAETVTPVAGIPLHAKRYSMPVYVEEGKTYVSIETATDAYVYQVDIATATSVKGAKIEGKTIKGFYNLYK